MSSIILSLFKPAVPVEKTVDSVLSAFNQTIADLQMVAARESETAFELQDQARVLSKQASEATVEASRAKILADRLAALVAA